MDMIEMFSFQKHYLSHGCSQVHFRLCSRHSIRIKALIKGHREKSVRCRGKQSEWKQIEMTLYLHKDSSSLLV
jgi:hypothetical protein